MLPPTRFSTLLRRSPYRIMLARAAASSSMASARSYASLQAWNAPLKPQTRAMLPHAPAASPLFQVPTRAFAAAASSPIVDVPVPEMGDSISEGTVIEWLKKPGDPVNADDVVVVLETDKVSVDVRSPVAGTFVQALAAVDENVLVGKSLFQLTTDASGAAANAVSPASPAAVAPVSEATKSSPAASSGDEVVVRVPEMGDSISEGTIVSWVKGVGDRVNADDVVLVIETDKVSVDVRTPTAGVIQELLAKVDQVVPIDAPLFKLTPTAGSAPAAPTPAPTAAATPAAPASAPAPATKPTPAVAAPAPPKPAAPAASTANVQPVQFPLARSEHREKMSRMRLRTAERLKQSQNTAASLTTFQEVDMTNIMALRKTYKDAFEQKHGIKLGFMSMFVKAATSALQEIPSVNARIDEKTQEIVYYDYVDMSVAVATPKGLVTPVLHNTESMSFADVEKTLAALAVKARDGQLAIEDLAGGNFTISNGGVFGSLMGTPIINVPQSSILGMHATKMRPVVRNGQIEARAMMYLALTYDHRLIDGREAVTCLKSIADKVENPERLLLDL